MKFQFDLLPSEYKSARRDTFSMILAVIAILIAVATIGMASMKNNGELSKLDKQINEKDGKLRSVINETSQLQPPTSKINTLKSSIEFINKNLDTPATDVVTFLTSLEACVPESVIIRDMTPKKMNDLNVLFTVNGEASTIQDILEFANRLNQSGKFKALLKSNQSSVVQEKMIQTFILEFSYKPQAR